MVNKAVVLATVKKMINSGIDDDTIKQTLLGIGQTESEIAAVLADAKGQAVEQPLPDQPGAAKAVEEKLDQAREEQAMRDEQLHLRMDEQQGKIGEVHNDVKKIASKFDFVSQAKPVEVPLSIEKDIAELKASSKAVQDLLKKILETNRQILFKLERKN